MRHAISEEGVETLFLKDFIAVFAPEQSVNFWSSEPSLRWGHSINGHCSIVFDYFCHLKWTDISTRWPVTTGDSFDTSFERFSDPLLNERNTSEKKSFRFAWIDLNWVSIFIFVDWNCQKMYVFMDCLKESELLELFNCLSYFYHSIADINSSAFSFSVVQLHWFK